MTESKRFAASNWFLSLGSALWALVLLIRWPTALSFGDEVGYVGQIRLVLQGRFRPFPADPGIWLATAHGSVAKYPYFASLLQAPLFLINPRLLFVVGLLAAWALTFVAARALRMWGQPPVWALVILMHPTVTLLARTAMTDLLLAALVVGAWWAARRDRVVWATVLAGAASATKVNGFVIVTGLLAGEAMRDLEALRRRHGPSIRRIGGLALGIAVGLAVTVVLNYAASGTAWFAYDAALKDLKTPPFHPGHLLTTAPVHLASLLLVPPLLLAGAWRLWKRRELGALVAAGGLILMMSCYYFVDRGRSFVETLLLSPRLILPAIAFLLIGYADLCATTVRRVAESPRLQLLVSLAPFLIALPISIRHRAWQAPEAQALAAANRAVAEGGQNVLGLTFTSTKPGMLFAGRTVAIESGTRPEVILCGSQYLSYRSPDDPGGAYDCNLPGYQRIEAVGSYSVLRRKDH
jgi:hypothetical protein